MNKKDLINIVSAKTGMNKKESEKAVAAVFESITQSLTNGEKVQIAGFGAFEIKERAERMAINPRTKEPISVPASKLPQFKPAKVLKEAVDSE